MLQRSTSPAWVAAERLEPLLLDSSSRASEASREISRAGDEVLLLNSSPRDPLPGVAMSRR